MRNQLRGFLCIAVLIGLCSAVRAQTLYGPGGLFIHPSAFTPPLGTVGLNVSYYTQLVGQDTVTEWLPVSLTYSLTDRGEIGALFIDRRFGQHRQSGGAFAKYQFLSDTPSHPAFAIAGSFISGDVKQDSVAGVFSHDFRQNGRTIIELDAGVQWGRRSDIRNPQDSVCGFIGIQVPLGSRFSLIGEAGTKFSFDRHEASAFGVMWAPSKSIQIGLAFVNTGRSKDNRFFAGVGYKLGGVSK